MTRYVWRFAGIHNGQQRSRVVASYMDGAVVSCVAEMRHESTTPRGHVGPARTDETEAAIAERGDR